MLQDNKKNWRRVYKSLLLLSYLILNGSERVVTSAREHLYDLKSLETYTCTDEFNRDQGNNVRQKVRDLIDFIQDDERLRTERKKARKAKDKFVGMSGMGSSGYSDRYDSEPRSSKDRSLDFNDEFDDRNWKDRFSSKKGDDDEDSEESLPEFMTSLTQPNEEEADDSFPSSSSRKSKVEFKDEEDEETFTSTTRTERKTKRTVRSGKKVDLGPSATYAVDTNGNKPTQSNGGDLINIPSGNQESFADFSSANNSLDDFNPRAGTEAPPVIAAPPIQADFANFQSSNQTSSQTSGAADSAFGDFQSNSSFSATVTQQSQTVSVTSMTSNVSLLSQSPVLQPQIMASTNPASSNLMQPTTPQQQLMQPMQPMQPTQAMQPPLMGSVPMGLSSGMSMQPTPASSQAMTAPTISKTSTSTTPAKMGTIWSDSKVNIDIDSLSLSDKYKKQHQPSMNQLQQQTSPQMGQVNMGATMPQGQMGMGMTMPPQQQGMMGMQGNMRMAPQGYGMQQPNMAMGMQPGMQPMQGNLGMQTGMGMQTPMGMRMGMMGQPAQYGAYGAK